MSQYNQQLELLLRILPVVADQHEFALHGGTAINLFHLEIPRISVDIDLTFISPLNRTDDLNNIRNGLIKLSEKIQKSLKGIVVRHNFPEGDDFKLFCNLKGIEVKVEVNTINRGVVKPVELREICSVAQSGYGVYCKAQLVPYEQLIGGKIVAALDRQHPRDLFDMMQIYTSSGLTDTVYKGFLFCLLSSKRPFHEILNPTRLDQKKIFSSQFSGMTSSEFTYEMFWQTRENLIKDVVAWISKNEADFLISFADGQPVWKKFDYSRFPGVLWKLINIDKLQKQNPEKHNRQIRELRNILGIDPELEALENGG